MREMDVLRSTVLAGLLVCVAPLSGQHAPELIARYGDIDAPALVGIVDVEERQQASAVLTRPDPALHIFDRDRLVEFGRSGGGPFELKTPVALAWQDSTLVVLDVNQKKFVAFLADGSPAYSRTLGSDWARRLYIAESDTVVGTFAPMSDERAIVRLQGATQDTLYRYSVQGRQIRLEAPGAPSLTLSAPFTAQVQWAVLRGGLVAIWEPESDHIKLLNMDAAEVASIEASNGRWRVGPADREHWLGEAIPSEFMGRRGVFDPLRRVAEREAGFPETFAPVLQLLGDPTGAVWVRKTTSGSGEVWVLLSRAGDELGVVRLPAGRKVLHVGQRGLYASWADDLGVEYVELYRRPAWADS